MNIHPLYNIPMHTFHAIKGWVDKGVPPGGFLYAVLTNNLRESVGRADEYNQAHLKEIVQYLWWEVPAGCWGSQKAVREWAESKRNVLWEHK